MCSKVPYLTGINTAPEKMQSFTELYCAGTKGSTFKQPPVSTRHVSGQFHQMFFLRCLKGEQLFFWESEVCGEVTVVRMSFGPEVLEETTPKESLWLLQNSMI